MSPARPPTDFNQRYERQLSEAEALLETYVFGTHEGVNGYTTPAQADALAMALTLRSESYLLDIGCGRGWPGRYLVRKSGCRAVLTDVPRSAVYAAKQLARRDEVVGRCRFALASGSSLPFRPRTFDAVVHADVLC